MKATTLIVLALLADPAGAENNVQSRGNDSLSLPELVDITENIPIGAASVSLREFLSSRIDQMKQDLLDRIELIEKQQRQLLDERDRQYAQRFEAQQKALSSTIRDVIKSLARLIGGWFGYKQH